MKMDWFDLAREILFPAGPVLGVSLKTVTPAKLDEMQLAEEAQRTQVHRLDTEDPREEQQ